jgi:UrcA family protein
MKTFSIIALVGASIVATAATAEPVRTAVAVSYADLNLSSDAGRAALARRINAAARSACSPDTSGFPPLRRISDRCIETAVADAQSAVALASAAQLTSR